MTLRDYAIRYGFIVLLVGLVAYFAIAADGFVSPQSAVFIFQSVAITGVLALGVTATLVVGGFDLSISPALEGFPSNDPAEDTARVIAGIEAMVRAVPAQYLWIHRRFKRRPDGGDVYAD